MKNTIYVIEFSVSFFYKNIITVVTDRSTVNNALNNIVYLYDKS